MANPRTMQSIDVEDIDDIDDGAPEEGLTISPSLCQTRREEHL